MSPAPASQRDIATAQVKAPQAPAPTISLAAERLVPAQLLDGGEIIILALKPSLWYIPLVSLRWLAVAAILVLASLWSGWAGYTSTLVQVAVVLALGRLAYAALQWASRSYYLTNRRVMRIRGVLTVDVFECPLTRIQNTRLGFSLPERLVRAGTITMSTAGIGDGHASWRTVARPLEVHEQLRAAIDKAHPRGTHSV